MGHRHQGVVRLFRHQCAGILRDPPENDFAFRLLMAKTKQASTNPSPEASPAPASAERAAAFLPHLGWIMSTVVGAATVLLSAYLGLNAIRIFTFASMDSL